jgi:CheY-like chemotaxis protein
MNWAMGAAGVGGGSEEAGKPAGHHFYNFSASPSIPNETRCVMATQDAGPFHGRAIHGNRLICAVDPDPNHLQYLTLLLHRLGYRVDAVPSEAAARRNISRNLPDLVIMHFRFVGDEDLAFLQELKRDQHTASLPVVAITSSGDLVGQKRCLDAGAADCLATPFQAEDLYYMVQKAIERIPRRNLRIPLRMPVYVNDGLLDCGAAGCDAILSAKGMYVQTRHPSAEREHLFVRFKLGDRPVSVKAHVLFSDYPGQALGRETGMGIYFTEIAPEDEAYIREYINRSITTGTYGGENAEPRH